MAGHGDPRRSPDYTYTNELRSRTGTVRVGNVERPNRRSATRVPMSLSDLPRLQAPPSLGMPPPAQAPSPAPPRPLPPVVPKPKRKSKAAKTPKKQWTTPSKITPVPIPVPLPGGGLTPPPGSAATTPGRATPDILTPTRFVTPVPLPSMPPVTFSSTPAGDSTAAGVKSAATTAAAPSGSGGATAGQATQGTGGGGGGGGPRPKRRKRGSDDGNSAPKKRARPAPPAGPPPAACDFCLHDPVGQQMAQTNRCDYTIIKGVGSGYEVECQNCADHRSRNPGIQHTCVVGTVNHMYKRYGVNDPNTYAVRACSNCTHRRWNWSCDMDSTLDYYCSNCRADYKCRADNGRQLELRRPGKLHHERSWFRHMCDRCFAIKQSDKRVDQADSCSWLANRQTWGQPCTRCVADGAQCLDHCNMTQPAAPPPVPRVWAMGDRFRFDGKRMVEVIKTTPWRRSCKACMKAGSTVRCVVRLDLGGFACERCTQIGITCAELDSDRTFPLYDLSKVGFGQYMPYAVCTRCKDEDQPCDRQRPCDSCCKAGGGCDPLLQTLKQNCIARGQTHGALYYLALGYGSDGVSSYKTGFNLEDWIGPVAPVYGVENYPRDHAERYDAVVNAHLLHRPPIGAAPPHGVAGGQLSGGIILEHLSSDDLGRMIRNAWPQAVPPHSTGRFHSIWASLRNQQLALKNVVAQQLAAQNIARPMAQSLYGNPLLPAVPPAQNPPVQQPVPAAGDNAAVGANNDGNSMAMSFDFDPDVTRRRPGDPDDLFSASRSMRLPRWINSRAPNPANRLAKQAALALQAGMAPSERGPPPVHAVTKEPFNPFLGFALDQGEKPRYSTRPRNSRWKKYNPLESLDMAHWHYARDRPAEDRSRPRLFDSVNGHKILPPSHDTLSDIPHKNQPGFIRDRCVEPNEGGYGFCNQPQEGNVKDCQSLAHRNTAPYRFPVCGPCSKFGMDDVFHPEYNPITEGELVGMRAYLCGDCAGHMSSSAQNAAQYHAVGARRIYGRFVNGDAPKGIYSLDGDPSHDIEFRPEAKSGTGCACADRMFGSWLCRFHRFYYAEEAMKQAALMREWRISRFKKPVCPVCLAHKPLGEVNESAGVAGFEPGQPTAWACLTCNEWVVNQENDEHNKPRLVRRAMQNWLHIQDLVKMGAEVDDVEMVDV
ncbi:hypothetical protein ACJZ2D_006905 [Fusarium nematophilum]